MAALGTRPSRPFIASAALLPLLPWLAVAVSLAPALVDPVARTQVRASGATLALYALGWSLAVVAGIALWRRVGEAPAPVAEKSLTGTPVAQPGARTTAARLGWIVVPLLAFAALVYWNNAVLDPLQARGFPDYVTQMKGARKLLAGVLPYDPTIRVWTDVNLPPITLLLLFAPFTPLSEFGGKLAYFALNHAAFLGGVALLLVAARPAGCLIGTGAWRAAVVALALAYEPWHDSLRLGQQNGIVFFFLALTAVALLIRRDALAGAALALALIGKPSAALLGIYFLFARRWRAAVAAAVVGLGTFFVTLPWTGVENWRFYLLEKAPEILAGTPQQSNVALLALHARLFLPTDALSSFDAMPSVPIAQWLTHVAQIFGLVALWCVVRPERASADRAGALLEYSFALVLSLSLTGHAWQSYTTWLIVAFVPLLDPGVWASVPSRMRPLLIALAAACYAALGINDVPLYKVVGNTTIVGALFASLPNVTLLVYAFLLALLLRIHDNSLAADQQRDTTSM